MSVVLEGIPASPGIVIARVRVVDFDVPRAPRGGTIAEEDVDQEVERLYAACDWAKERIREIQQRTAETAGEAEAGIFEAQMLMLEDADLVEAAAALIRDNHLTAERAFEWRVLEWQSQWAHTAHPMIVDKLNDLGDIQARVLRRLMGLRDPAYLGNPSEPGVILVANDLSPSMTAQLERVRVAGIATDLGTRTSHSAILARSLDIPAIVSLIDVSRRVSDGQEVILDGRTGRLIIDPSAEEKEEYRERDFRLRNWEQELLVLSHLDSVTRDGSTVDLRANLDLPVEAQAAHENGAAGVGLLRTEFLVVGKHVRPEENEQFDAIREVLAVFEDRPVLVRTFDLGGDKFPAFLHIPKEDNPFLGWRAIRVCLDEPEMFLAQLRAILRVARYGDLRLMFPLINDLDEIRRARAMFERAAADLRSEGLEMRDDIPVGIMVETPAAAMIADELAADVDFFSVGTNDLIQYTLAVDRGNARLARLYTPFHPGVVRLLQRVADAARGEGIEASVCGEMAAHPLGAFLLIGMGYDALSVGPASLPEVKKVIRSISRAEAEAAAKEALEARSALEVMTILEARLPDDIDLTLFSGSWNLPEAN